MNARKLRGIGFFVSGGISIGLGVIFTATNTNPGWLPLVLTIAGLVGNAIGFKIVYPDTN